MAGHAVISPEQRRLAPLPKGGEGGEAPLAVYIHWPFCRSKCPYCDFNSHVRDGVDAARWTRALLADLDHHAGLAPDRTGRLGVFWRRHAVADAA